MTAQCRTENCSQGSPHNVWHFDILIADGFVLTELSAIVDVLRIANRVSLKAPFSWTCRSKDGGIVESSGGAFVRSQPFSGAPVADYMFALGNSDPDNPALSLGTEIPRYTHRNAKVYLLAEAASRFISEGRGDGNIVTTHWENLAFMRERDPQFDADTLIAAETNGIFTCAGMTSTIDVVLSIAGQHMSPVETAVVADIMLLERVRDFGTRQTGKERNAQRSNDRLINGAIATMHEHLEDPISISVLACELGMSQRSLERRFVKKLGVSPHVYYRELRLNHALNLLLNTSLTIQEIGLACGYPSGFAKQFRNLHGVTPTGLRRRIQNPGKPDTRTSNHTDRTVRVCNAITGRHS